MKRLYVLQELYIINHRNYWYDVCASSDIKMTKRLKELYKHRYVNNIYRVSEVVY